MATKDWTFDISKLSAGKPLTPVSFGGMPQNQPNQTNSFLPPVGTPKPPLGSGPINPIPAPTQSGLGVFGNQAAGIKPVAAPTPIVPPTTPPTMPGQFKAPPLPMALTTPQAPVSWSEPAKQQPIQRTSVPMPVSGSMSEADRAAAAAAAGAAKNASASSAAAGQAGQKTEQANAAAVAKASGQAAKGAAAPATPSAQSPAPPAPVTPFQDSWTKAMETLNTIVSQEDPQFKAALNQYITTTALMDQAERDALKMQINQDPALRGQGAGLALMQVLNRNQNFNLDQGIAQLSNANLERIVNLQKYGLEMGMKITEARSQAQKEAFNTLLSNGQFEGAATALQGMFDEQFPGLGLKVDAGTLQSRDPFTLNQLQTKLDFVKDLAASNPTAALPIVQSMLTDPQIKDYFPDGITAEQVIQSFASGQIPQNLTQAEGIQKIINGLAATGQSFEETGNSYAEMFRLMGRNAPQEGRKLSAEDINALRASQGLPAFQTDASGNLVDSEGNPLDDQDYAELAYRKDYQDRVAKASEKPWEAVYNQLLGTPGLGEKLLKPELYPGANDAVKKILAGISLGTDLFYQDPQTGEWSLDMNKANLSESNPELQPYFMNWPTAVFDTTTGEVLKDASGNPIYTPGGYVYGEVVNGKPVIATPEDQAMDQAYFAYRNTGGKLTPNEWYFATQGGKTQPNEKNIPEAIKPQGEDFTDGNATGEDNKSESQSLVSQLSGIGKSASELAKWTDARGSNKVSLGDDLIGEVVSTGSGKSGVYIELNVNGKTIGYLVSQDKYMNSSTGKTYKTAKEAIASYGA